MSWCQKREPLVFMVQGKINRGRHTDHPAGCNSIRIKQCPPPPSPYFFMGRMPFLLPNQQCQSTEGNSKSTTKLIGMWPFRNQGYWYLRANIKHRSPLMMKEWHPMSDSIVSIRKRSHPQENLNHSGSPREWLLSHICVYARPFYNQHWYWLMGLIVVSVY